MRTFIFLGIVLFGAVAAAAGDAPIERVVVFADRAEVTRAATASCHEGKGEAVFAALPVQLDERTLRAEASGGAKAIGTSSRRVPLEQDRDERVAALRKEILALSDQMRELQDTAAGLQERVQGVGNYGAFFLSLLGEEMRNPRPDVRRWERVMEGIQAERKQAAAKEQEIEIKLRKLGRKLERLERRLARLRPRAVAEGMNVSVAVECGSEAHPKVALAYVIPGATWHPEYDLRFIPAQGQKVGQGRVELTVAAVVQQATGEDWKDVRLVLSTSKPKLGAEAPVPAPIYVDGHEVGEERVLVTSMEDRRQLAGPAGGTTEAGPAAVELEDRGQAVALTLPRPVTVMADGRPYWMPVDVVGGEGEAKLVATPKLRPYVYQLVSFKNPARYPLLAGRVHSYRAGSYVGDTELSYKAAGEPLEVSLGIDEEIKVERKDLKEIDRRAGFLSGTKHLERLYRIKLCNRAKAPQRVELRENLPVSKTEEVEVELQKDKTSPGYTFDRERGFLTWAVPLGKGEEKEINLGFTIHLPKDWSVQ